MSSSSSGGHNVTLSASKQAKANHLLAVAPAVVMTFGGMSTQQQSVITSASKSIQSDAAVLTAAGTGSTLSQAVAQPNIETVNTFLVPQTQSMYPQFVRSRSTTPTKLSTTYKRNRSLLQQPTTASSTTQNNTNPSNLCNLISIVAGNSMYKGDSTTSTSVAAAAVTTTSTAAAATAQLLNSHRITLSLSMEPNASTGFKPSSILSSTSIPPSGGFKPSSTLTTFKQQHANPQSPQQNSTQSSFTVQSRALNTSTAFRRQSKLACNDPISSRKIHSEDQLPKTILITKNTSNKYNNNNNNNKSGKKKQENIELVNISPSQQHRCGIEIGAKPTSSPISGRKQASGMTNPAFTLHLQQSIDKGKKKKIFIKHRASALAASTPKGDSDAQQQLLTAITKLNRSQTCISDSNEPPQYLLSESLEVLSPTKINLESTTPLSPPFHAHQNFRESQESVYSRPLSPRLLTTADNQQQQQLLKNNRSSSAYSRSRSSSPFQAQQAHSHSASFRLSPIKSQLHSQQPLTSAYMYANDTHHSTSNYQQAHELDNIFDIRLTNTRPPVPAPVAESPSLPRRRVVVLPTQFPSLSASPQKSSQNLTKKQPCNNNNNSITDSISPSCPKKGTLELSPWDNQTNVNINSNRMSEVDLFQPTSDFTILQQSKKKATLTSFHPYTSNHHEKQHLLQLYKFPLSSSPQSGTSQSKLHTQDVSQNTSHPWQQQQLRDALQPRNPNESPPTKKSAQQQQQTADDKSEQIISPNGLSPSSEGNSLECSPVLKSLNLTNNTEDLIHLHRLNSSPPLKLSKHVSSSMHSTGTNNFGSASGRQSSELQTRSPLSMTLFQFSSPSKSASQVIRIRKSSGCYNSANKNAHCSVLNNNTEQTAAATTTANIQLSSSRQAEEVYHSHRYGSIAKFPSIPCLPAVLQVFRHFELLRNHLRRPLSREAAPPVILLRSLFFKLDSNQSMTLPCDPFFLGLVSKEEKKFLTSQKIVLMLFQTIIDEMIARTLAETSVIKPDIDRFLKEYELLKRTGDTAGHLSKKELEAIEMYEDSSITCKAGNAQLFSSFASLIKLQYLCQECGSARDELEEFEILEIGELLQLEVENGVVITGRIEADYCLKCRSSRLFEQQMMFLRVPKLLCIAVQVAAAGDAFHSGTTSQTPRIPTAFSLLEKATQSQVHFELIAEIEKKNQEFYAVCRCKQKRRFDEDNSGEVDEFNEEKKSKVYAFHDEVNTATELKQFPLNQPLVLVFEQKERIQNRGFKSRA